MTVLITGGGLIGSQVARLEQEAGRRPVVFDSAPNTGALADFLDLSQCDVVRGDVCNALDLLGTCQGYEVTRVIHTAAFGGLLLGSNSAPLTSTIVNTMGAANVLETARLLQLDRVVLASSSAIYISMTGGGDEGAYGFEEAQPRPGNVYAANKQAAEDLGRAYRATFGLDVVAVRYAAAFGPWRSGGGGLATSAVERWLSTAMNGQRVEVDLTAGDWIYSKDAARGTHLACWADNLESQLFNLGMGRNYTSQDVADAINSAVPGNLAVVALGTATPTSPPMSIDRARSQLGFEVGFPMPEAIADYRDWLASRSIEGP